MVPAGAFTLSGTGPAAPQFSQLPTFCRVAATLTPSSDSDIKIEVWLPAANWNGKSQAVGNGGWAGTISYGALASALQEGYATASTDTGHAGGNASFAIGHPEKVVDFAYRAVHEMAVKSKAIIAAFYDRAPRFSYWTGCSTGGRQALMEAQRYPEDFDGIIAGAPANNQTQLCAWRIAVEARILQSPASIVPPAKLALLNRAVLAACDAIDGVTDGLLTDPHQCHFDPATLLCRGVDMDDCLTARQVEAVKLGYAQPDEMANDPDLQSIRPDTHFPALLEDARRNLTPCAYNAENRQFDFWVGNWDVVTTKEQTSAGTSHIEKTIGDCVIWENWASLGTGYRGKSYNIYNASLKRWEQFWVDNAGGMIHFFGALKNNVMDFYTDDIPQPDGTKLRRHLQFFNLGPEKVRQFSQGSTDGGSTWSVEYDFTYNRRK